MQTNFIYNAGVVQNYLVFYFTILAYRLFACFQPVPLIQTNTTAVDTLDMFRLLIKNTSTLNSKKLQI